ncbi:hypothetical protein [Rhizobium leguminosarum]|uniref:hypothetical protein n=1 Tax=Rhizobium leguminosarum TaxID=384 RepID=UPI002E1296BD|nr:hypothetical protein U8Q02_39935 [Rhizobium leguminosarum]
MDAAYDSLSRVAGQVERLFAEPGASMTIEIAETRLRFERRTFGAISFPHVAFSPDHRRIRGSGWVLVATDDGELISHVNIADIDRIFVTDGGANDR